MIPDTLNPETHITTIELQNETRSTKITKPAHKSLTCVKIHEILKQENPVDHESNAEIINVKNVDTAVSDVQGHETKAPVTNLYRLEKRETNFRKVFHRYPKSNEQGTYPKHYWVQFNLSGGMPEGSSPMYYDSERNSFVAIVLAITLVMLLITATFVGYIYFSDDSREYFKYDGKPFLFLGLGGMLILNYTMMCSTCARVLPCNVIVLFLAVFFMTLITAYVTASYSTDIIFYALVATAITVFVCFILALTSFDFTQFLLYIIAISVAFAALVLLVTIVSLTSGIRYKPLHLVILVLGTILNVIILIMQLQMILGGRTIEISEDDWALAAFMLYTSIVDIFLQLLQLLGWAMDE